MKWIVSVQFSRPKAYHLFFSLVNRKRIKDTVLVNYSHADQIVEFETTTKPEEQKIKQMGAVVNVKILEVK
jgi:hypothetical protein